MPFTSRHKMGTFLLAGGLGIACGVLPSFFKADPAEGIRLSSESLDFGNAELFDTPQATLEITNPQRTEITVSFHADCSCVELSQKALLIRPGETAKVDVQLRRTAGGEVRQGYRPISRDLEIQYPLQGTRRSTRVALTGRFFEPLVVDEAACDVRVQPFEQGNASIGLSAQVDITDIEVLQRPSWCRAATIDWNKEYQAGHLCVSLDPLPDTQQLEDQITLVFSYRRNERSESASLRIPIRARVEVPISLDPPLLAFRAGEAETRRVQVQLGILLRGQAAARITELDSPSPELRCKLNEEMPESFSVFFAGADAPETDSAEIRLQVVLDSPEYGRLSVPLKLPVVVL